MRVHRPTGGVVLLLAAAFLGGCGVGGTPTAGPSDDGPARTVPGPRLLAASSGGAVVLDVASGTIRGVARGGRQLWRDRAARAAGAQVICQAQCPDAVVSGQDPTAAEGGSPEKGPYQYVRGRRRPFPTPSAPTRLVLTARSGTDAVVAERDARGHTWLVAVAGTTTRRVPLPGDVRMDDVVWEESPGRDRAIAFAGNGSGDDRPLWRFRHDREGWRADGRPTRRGPSWGGCVAGDRAVLVGPRGAAMLVGDDRRVPLATGIGVVGECRLGPEGGVLVQRQMDSDGRPATALQGFGADGAATWTRQFSSEALVEVAPDGGRQAIVHDGVLDLLDRHGNVVGHRDQVSSALFTAEGELVTTTPSGQVRWLPPTALG